VDAFSNEPAGRLPLACATLELFAYPQHLAELYDRHRGGCYTDSLAFAQLLGLVRDCLLQHQGGGHRLYQELERA